MDIDIDTDENHNINFLSTSSSFTYTTNIPPKVSKCGKYIAYVNSCRLVIRTTKSLATKKIVTNNELLENTGVNNNKNTFSDNKRNSKAEWADIHDIIWESIDTSSTINGIEHTEKQSGKLAVIMGDDIIKVYDIYSDSAVTIRQGYGGIEKLEWLMSDSDSKNKRSNLLLVYSENELYATMWSLQYNEKLFDILRPKSPCHVLNRPGRSTISIITRPDTHDYITNYTILKENSLISKLNTFETHNPSKKNQNYMPFVDIQTDLSKWSKSGKWLLIVDNSVLGLKMGLFNLFGFGETKNDAMMKFNSTALSERDRIKYGSFWELNLGPSLIEWYWDKSRDKELIFVGDDNENIVIFDILFDITAIIFHNSLISDDDTVIIWKLIERRVISKENHLDYQLVRQPFQVPQVSQQGFLLPNGSGIKLMKFSPDGLLLAVVCGSMPETLFIWDVSILKMSKGTLEEGKRGVISVITHPKPIQDLEFHPSFPDLLYIGFYGKANYFSIWSYHWNKPYSIVNNGLDSITGINWIPDYESILKDQVEILCWNSNSFNKIQLRLYGFDSDLPKDNVNEVNSSVTSLSLGDSTFERERQGSPDLLGSDDTKVREIVEGVQQSEWGQRAFEVDDTFGRIKTRKSVAIKKEDGDVQKRF